MEKLEEIAARARLTTAEIIPWGEGVGKVRADVTFDDREPSRAKLVLVSAITPTPVGEGKTTTTIGLTDAFRRRGMTAIAALRQPSMGPTLGGKGGGAGGGRSHLEPFDRVNLGLTGDLHAIGAAHNMLGAMADNALHFGTTPLDARRVDWPFVIDIEDRSLRKMVIGLGGAMHGIPREARFDITAASEVMAILCLAKDWKDLKNRLSRIRVGMTATKEIVTAGDLGAANGMAALLRDAMMPNLVSTFEGSPSFVHGGPFANVAHGCCSIASMRLAMRRADVVVTEAGFGFDLGGEKFLDLVAPLADLRPDAVVIVATLRALKLHGGVPLAEAGKPNMAALEKGAAVLAHHVSIAKAFGLSAPVISINAWNDDPPDELARVVAIADRLGAAAGISRAYELGGEGALPVADLVRTRLSEPKPLITQLYAPTDPLLKKIEKVATAAYGASGLEVSEEASRVIKRAEESGLGNAGVCIAKTPLSLTADPANGGLPRPHVLPIRSARISAGAGFLVALCGEMTTMPGLGKSPAFTRIGLDDEGTITGVK